MANVKKIIQDWSETGKTAYVIVRREADSFRLNDADGTYTANPADPYLSLAEDSVIKGRYEVSESRAVWNDGRYTIAAYKQAGGSPAPVSDTIIGTGEMVVLSDNEIYQTGDSYAIVNHADYGNAKLVRSTTPANTLDVSATGEAGLDFNNIKDATGAKTLTNITVPIVSDVTTKTGYALSTAGVQAIWDALTSALTTVGSVGKKLADWLLTGGKVTVGTNDDKTGYSISGTKTTLDALNDISAAQVNTEVDTAIADARLDELLVADSDIDGAAPPTVGSVFHELLTKTAGSFTYDQTTDSVEAIRDRGDSAWITAVGFSTHTAADVWAVGTRTLTSFGTLIADIWAYATRILTAGTNIVLAKGVGITGFNDITGADVWAVATRTLTDKAGFSLAADQSGVTFGTVNTVGDKNGYRLSATGVDDIWDEDVDISHQTAGTAGKKLDDAGAAADPWSTAVPGAYGAGTAGKILGDNLNATVSSRSSHSAADIWTSGTRTLTSFGTLVADIWAYSTRTLTAFSTSLAVSVWDVLESAIATASSIGLKVKTNLDTTVSSRSSHSAADVWAVGTRTLTSFGTLATSIWTYATRKLTSAWTDESPSRDMAATLEGIYTVTITAYKTATVTPIPGYDIHIYNSDETVYFGKVTTNSLGIATFNRDNGTYKLRGILTGYVAVNTVETVVVAGVNVAKTVYADLIPVIPAPGVAGACTVYEYCFMPDGATPMTSIEAKARIKKLPYSYSGKLYTGQDVDGIYNASTGLVYWIIVYGAEVVFTINKIYPGGITKTIPSVGTIRLSEII